MMGAYVDQRMLVQVSEKDRLARIRRVLEVLEAGDEPRFNFYDYEHRVSAAVNTR